MGKKKDYKDRFREREASKYEHPIPSREFILDLLAERGRPATYRQLLSELELNDSDEKEALRRRLIAMVRDGQLHQNRRGAYGPLAQMELITGFVVGHKEGYGFVVPDDEGDDLFINARQMKSVFHNDRVVVRVSGIDHKGRREGVIVDVLERNTKNIAGRLMSESGIYFVEPSNVRISQDILVPPEAIGNAAAGQMVVVEMVEYPTLHTRPLGKVIEVLGDHMAPGMEIDVAIRNHDLPHVWPEEVIQEAASMGREVPDAAIEGRSDFRQLPFVTIDGEDAKDFDDAVFCEKTKIGWRLFVAIADVSHYVKPNTALDDEALRRGNSVYFPGNVIPMLPEVLSNELCSLNPHVNRLTMVCEMSISEGGKITRYRFHEGVIKSHARLTYNEVHQMIQKGDVTLQKKYESLLPHLKELFVLYRVLHKARKARGAIDFDMPETKIIFGEGRKIDRIVPSVRNDAHRVIEECMLCANISAAKFLVKSEYDSLFRIHEGPSPDKLADVRRFLGELGLKLPGREEPQPRDYAELLTLVASRPDAAMIQTVLLRSLSQAIYSGENKGHFGLAYEAYAHFTSPIRRYPDLLVHRAIRRIIRRQYKPGEKDSKLHDYGVHCSMTERRADEATREAVDWLKCEYMQDKVGEEFKGNISSVTSFGIFVLLKDVYVEGLIHISLLPNDYYHFDAIKHEMLGEKSRRRFRLGDEVEVKVVRVDLDERKIDFMLTESLNVAKKEVPVQKGQKKQGKQNKQGKKGKKKRSS